MTRRLLVAAMAVALLSFPIARAIDQDDAGIGGDASNDARNPTSIAFGSYSGTLDVPSGDEQDAYIATMTKDAVIHLRVTADVYVDVLTFVDGNYAYNSAWDQSFLLPAGHTLTFDVDKCCTDSPVDYNFTVEELPTSDVAVSNLTVTDVPQYVPVAGELPVTQRDVAFDVADVGLGDAPGAVVDVDVIGTTGTRSVSEQTIDLASGASRHLEVAWDATGQVGEFVVRVTVSSRFDENHANDVASTGSAVIVDTGAGLGLDLTTPLNQQEGAGVLGVGAAEGTHLTGHHIGAGWAAYFLVGSAGVWFDYDRDTGQLVVGGCEPPGICLPGG